MQDLSDAVEAIFGGAYGGYASQLRAEELAKLGPLGDSIYSRPTSTPSTWPSDSKLSTRLSRLLTPSSAWLRSAVWLGRSQQGGSFQKLQQDEAKTVARGLELILRHLHREPERVFDERLGEYREVTEAELKQGRKSTRNELANAWSTSLRTSNEYFCRFFPFDTPLPKGVTARVAEQDRRAFERAHARERGIAAIEEIVGPIERGVAALDVLKQELLLASNPELAARAERPAPAPHAVRGLGTRGRTVGSRRASLARRRGCGSDAAHG